MTKVKLITTFRNITKVGVDMLSSRFYKRNNVSPSLANSTATCTVFVLCQLLITKQPVTICIPALYKLKIVSIDVITQQM